MRSQQRSRIPKTPRMARSRQRGFTLIEAMGALVIFALISLGYANNRIHEADAATSKTAAQHDDAVRAGANQYLFDNRAALLAGTPIACYAVPMSPTLTELQNSTPPCKGQIPPGYDVPNALGMIYDVTLTRLPAGCTPGVSCTDVTGLLTSLAPLIDPASGTANGARVGEIANMIGSDAAFSLVGSGTVLQSSDGDPGWTSVPNPRGNTPGTIAMRIGFGSRGYANLDALLPRDGSRGMVGPLGMGGNPINGASNITATGTVNTNNLVATGNANITGNTSITGTTTMTGNATAGGTLNVAGAVTGSNFSTTLVPAGAACAPDGAIASGAGTPMVCSGGIWKPVIVTANLNDPCPTSGTVALAPSGQQLICRNGFYVPTVKMFNKRVNMLTVPVVDGSVVPKIACEAGGVADSSVNIISTIIDITKSIPRQGFQTSIIDLGGAWQVSIKLIDDTGAQFSAGPPYNVSANFNVECRY